MKKTTLAIQFAALRAESGLTLQEAANLCDLAQTTVLKVESNRPVRWQTLHLILTAAFKLKPSSDRYKLFHELWLKQAGEKAETLDEGYAAKKLSAHAAAAVKKFRKMIRDLDPKEINKVMDSAAKAVVRLKP